MRFPRHCNRGIRETFSRTALGKAVESSSGAVYETTLAPVSIGLDLNLAKGNLRLELEREGLLLANSEGESTNDNSAEHHDDEQGPKCIANGRTDGCAGQRAQERVGGRNCRSFPVQPRGMHEDDLRVVVYFVCHKSSSETIPVLVNWFAPTGKGNGSPLQ